VKNVVPRETNSSKNEQETHEDTIYDRNYREQELDADALHAWEAAFLDGWEEAA
jgi:hypothetical protein